MQLMLPHEQAHEGSQDSDAQDSQEDAAQSIHIDLHDIVFPLRRQVLDFFQAVSNAVDDLGGVFPVSESVPQFCLKDVLEDGGCDGYPYSRARASEGVRGGLGW